MTMIERVARGIDPGIWNGVDHLLERLGARNEKEAAEDRAEVLGRPHVVQSLDRARAAIEAFRTLPDSLLQAIVTKNPEGICNSEMIQSLHSVIVDASLKEKP